MRRNATVLAPIPALKPVVRELLVDAQGRLWVGRYSVSEKRNLPEGKAAGRRSLLTYRERNRYDLLSIDSGTYQGTVVLPQNARVMAFERDKVWLVEEDASGAEQLVAYTLLPPGAP
ncbi:MAG: hypothetical protein ACKVS7_06275 [Gemmatimonadaceae bacterium]